MAKLSINESVTTDTLAGICEVLNCDIGDIATFSREPTAFSVYDAHKKFGKKIDETEFLNKYEFTYKDRRFVAYITKRKADKGGAPPKSAFYLISYLSPVVSTE